MVSTLVVILCAAFGLSLVTNWAARGAARRIGLVDRPDGHRKLQSQAVPLGGGVAIFVSTFLTVLAVALIDPRGRWSVGEIGHEVVGLFAGATLIVFVGLLDDSIGLRGRQKLLGQVAAATAIWAFGISIETIHVLDWSWQLGLLSAPFTIFWLLGAMNALNLLDGIDGLAATVGFVLSTSITFLALATEHDSVALVAATVAGSTGGFLWFNFPPATMYLGDAGSMLLGLMVGVLAIQSSLKGPGTVLLAAPLALWTIPIFDSAAAILRRTLTGRSIYTTDRAHLHHHLIERIGHRKTLLCIAGVSLLTSAAALLSIWRKNDLIAIACAGIVVFMFVALRVFGHSELLLVVVRLRALVRSFFVTRRRGSRVGWDDAVRLQGTRQWELLWETLAEWAVKLELVQVRLDVNFPTLGEGFHATWNRRGEGRDERFWRLHLPLIADRRVVGSVKVVGERASTGEQTLEHLQDLVEQIERHLQKIAAPKPVAPDGAAAVNGVSPHDRDASPERDASRERQHQPAVVH